MLLFCAAGLVVEEPKENEKQVTPQLSVQHIVQSTGRRRGKEVTRKSARTSEQRRKKVRIKATRKCQTAPIISKSRFGTGPPISAPHPKPLSDDGILASGSGNPFAVGRRLSIFRPCFPKKKLTDDLMISSSHPPSTVYGTTNTSYEHAQRGREPPAALL